MAFENTTVLRAVLDAFEPNTLTGETSMSVSGLPLAYAFQASSSLDYLREVKIQLDEFHDFIDDEVASSYAEETMLGFIDFADRLSALYTKYECIRKNYSEPASEYLERFITYSDDSFNAAVDSIEYFSVYGETAERVPSEVRDRVRGMAAIYSQQLMNSLRFLAYGAFMDEDALQNEVDAWLEIFGLFSNLEKVTREIELDVRGENGI